jgi:DNA-binding NarL/FixJ family response regulator
MIRPRVLIADDHTLLLEAFRRLLSDDCDVVGAVSDGRALVEAATTLMPDVVVVDIGMPLLNGIDAMRAIRQAVPRTRIIVLTMNEDVNLAVEAFRVGASGYLLKRSAASELSTAIREVASNRSYVTPLMTEGLLMTTMQPPGPNSVGRTDGLSPRQREVVQLVAEGRSMKEVAAILSITPRTVAFHKYRVMEQLQVKTTAELIRFAVKHHIV